MADQKRIIRVGSRKSQLALIQTNKVISMLQKTNPDVQFEIEKISTQGDKILDIALSKIGEKALFTKELEIALEEKQVDFVVHSLKDLPTVLPDGMLIGAVCERDDPRDAVVMHPKHGNSATLASLPAGSVVGTSSLRRASQLRKIYPQLQIKDIRGNLNTRLRKLDEASDYDCIVLAQAGLERMDWAERSAQVLAPSEFMYAVSQGAMAVECRIGDQQTLDMLGQIHNAASAVQVVAERAFLKTLEGGCSVPVAVHCDVQGRSISLRGAVFSVDGTQEISDKLTATLPVPECESPMGTDSCYSCIYPGNARLACSLEVAEKLGEDLAHIVIGKGAAPILNAAKAEAEAAIRAREGPKTSS